MSRPSGSPQNSGSNDFFKKLENQTAALALCYMHYTFVRIRQTLRVTLTMATGVIKTLWEVPDIMALLDRKNTN